MSLSGNCTCSHCYAQIRDSPRSWCEQGFLKIQVTGNQKVSGAPDDLLQLTAISQLGGFMMGLQTPCSVGCVSWGSRHHQLAVCVLWKSKKKLSWLCWRFLSFAKFPFILFPPTPISPLFFGPVCFDPFCDLCSFVAFLICDPCPSGFVFWENVTPVIKVSPVLHALDNWKIRYLTNFENISLTTIALFTVLWADSVEIDVEMRTSCSLAGRYPPICLSACP